MRGFRVCELGFGLQDSALAAVGVGASGEPARKPASQKLRENRGDGKTKDDPSIRLKQ